MNKRIKELADEAAKYAAICALPTGKSGDELFVERFAELIISDCVDVIMTKDRYRREYFARVVQRRFGMLDDGDNDE